MCIAFSGTKLVNSAFFHAGSTVAFPPGTCYNDIKNSAEVLSVKKSSVVLLLMLLLTTGCRREVPEETTIPTIPETTQSTTVPETTAAPTVAQTEPTPEHSALWDPELPLEDVLHYFREVCLDAEFTNSGDPSVLQKWDTPICYQIYGTPTDEDTAVLTAFADWLNGIEGFPGIQEATEPWQANLRIHFCTQEELVSLMGEQFSGMDGAVTFWYENDIIYDAIICIRTEISQELRNSVILEELYNALGPIQDTALREDSIIYAGYSEPQCLTQTDELLLKLLYHPTLTCGMTYDQCADAIRALYY